MKILVSGGAGYIGSTVCSALEDAGHTPVILDNLSTGCEDFTRGRIFYKCDIADGEGVKKIFSDHPDIFAVIHCAALIIVPDSVSDPYSYYLENVSKSVEFFKSLNACGCKRILFSSSASVYDNVEGFSVDETAPVKPLSPYARTKLMIEMILEDYCRAYGVKGISLRYFNPIGADPQMRSGPFIKNATHILAKMVSVGAGEGEFTITGTDWNTRDGSGLRDYIHIWDLARAHVMAVERFDHAAETGSGGYLVINIGSGSGTTVKELVAAFERVSGRTLPKREAPARPGDVAGAYADTARALELLGWKAEKGVDEAIADALEWNRRFFN